MPINKHSVVGAYAAVATVGLCIFAALWWSAARSTSNFKEITVERINVVDADGSVRIVLANRERFPDPVVNGVVSPRSSSHPGFLFYNDQGDECGGLVFSGGADQASTSLLFDRRQQDQTVGLSYSEWNEKGHPVHRAGMQVWDRPDLPLNEVMAARSRISSIEDDTERKVAIGEFLKEIGYPDPFGSPRLFVGRETTGEAGLFLRDRAGRVRLRMVVSDAGEAKVEFVDEAGQVVRTIGPQD